MDENALFTLTHGLYIIGAKDDNGRYVGSCVDAIMQVANKPLVLALSCNNLSYTKEVIEKTHQFSISVIHQNANPYIIADFGFQSSKTIDKWQYVPHNFEHDLPVLEDCIASFVCKVHSIKAFESNTLFLASIEDGHKSNQVNIPLTYNNYRDYLKEDVINSFTKNPTTSALEPKTAYRAHSTPSCPPIEQENWTCSVCGYAYDQSTNFEDLPSDWLCPLCGQDKSHFSKV